MSVVTKWMDDHFMLGFVPTVSGQNLHRLNQSPLDQTINWSPHQTEVPYPLPMCEYTCKKITYMHIKNPAHKHATHT